jgi:hypothetical protein
VRAAPAWRWNDDRRPAPTLRLAGLLALVAGCQGQVGGGSADAGAAGGRDAAGVEVARPDAGSGRPDDAGGAAIAAPDAPPDLRPPGPLVTMSAPSGTFSQTFYLQLMAAGPSVRLFITLDGTIPIETTAPHVGPIRMDRSAQLRVLAIDGELREHHSAVYLQTTPELATFSSSLPLVFLHGLAGGEPLPLQYQNVPGAMLITRPDQGVARPAGPVDTAGRIGWRVRGRTSREADQRSYSVELWGTTDSDDLPLPVLGLPAQSDWVLHGPYKIDASLVRNAFAYAVSNRIGRYAPRTRFVEVFVESAGRPLSPASYRGVYTLVEKVKRDKHRVDVAPLRPADADPARLTGGYIFKVDDNFAPGDMGLLAGGEKIELEDPGRLEITPAQRAYLQSYLDQVAAAVAAPGGRHPTTGLHYSDYIDIPSFIDFHILNVFTKNPDAFRLSAYYFKDRGGKLQAGPMWDLDRSMGANDYRDPTPEGWSASLDGTKVFEYGWWKFLFLDPAFEDLYWKRWDALLATELRSELLIPLLVGLAAEVAPAQPRHVTRWPLVAPVGGYSAELQRLSAWIDARLTWIRGHLRQR